MGMAYTLHQELDDATFTEAFNSRPITNKREALRIARACAKGPTIDVVKICVVDTKTDLVVATFPTKNRLA